METREVCHEVAFARLLAVVFLLVCLPSVRAAYVVQLDGLSQLGPQVVLAIDLIDGDGPSNFVTLGPTHSDGSITLLGLTGSGSGSPATSLRLADDSFFSEALLQVDGADRLRFQLDFTTGPGWTLTFIDVGTVPEPASWLLVLTALVLLVGRRAVRPAAAMLLGLSLLASAPARADDLSGSVQISRGGLVLNRITNTFDASVTVRNTSAVPLLGPLKLALSSASPAQVALYNSYGRLAGGADYVMLPLADGILAPGASTTGIVRLITGGAAVKSTQFALDGQRLVPGQTAQVDVRAVFAAGYLGPQATPVGPGFRVLVNGVSRGVTDAGGRLVVGVPAGPVEVVVQRPPNEGGSQLVAAVSAGSTALVTVPIDDGKEVAADTRLQLDALQQGVLSRQAGAIVLRFVETREQSVKLSALYGVDLVDATGNLTPLTSIFGVRPDGTVAASASAFYQALAGRVGKLSLQVGGEDATGAIHAASRDFHLADYRVRVQLAAPPSNPALPLAGVRVTATILNSDLRFQAESDANGLIALPDLPRGNLSLSGSVSANGIVHVGQGTVPLGGNALVTLTLRAPTDILANVPAINLKPLPTGMAVQSSPSAAANSRLAGSASQGAQQPGAVDPVRAARHAAVAARRATPPAGASRSPAAAAAVPSATVSVSAAQQNAVMENSDEVVGP